MAHDIFISHAQADKAVADLVCATLEQRGVRCWIAPRDIQPGADWSSAIVAAIRQSRAMVLVFSDAANASRHIPRELERAIDLEIPIVPFRIENIAPRGSLEYNLALVHWLDAVNPPLESHASRLADVVTAMLATPETPAAPAAPAARVVAKPIVDARHSEMGVVSDAPASNKRAIWLAVAAFAVAGVAVAWGVTRHQAPPTSVSAPTNMSQAVAANDPSAPVTSAPAPAASTPNNADPDAKTPSDAEATAWKSCNEPDQAAAIAACTAVIQAKGDDPAKTGRAFFNRAMAYYGQANYDAAIADYSQALALNFAPAYSYSDRGMAYAAKKDFVRAAADYDLAIQANPAFTDAYRNRALASAFKGNYQAAVADLNQAVILDPDNVDVHLTRAVVYLLLHDSERSLADVAAYITKKPDDAAGYRIRGFGYFQRGLFVLAKEDFARCLKLNAADAQALYAQGAARERTGDASGRDDVAAGLKIDPSITDLMTALGVVRK